MSDLASTLVVTPTLGRSRWLGETVASVRTHAPWATHVLVCPAEAVERMAAAHAGVEVVVEGGGGLYPAVRGVLDSRSWGWATWLNDDDRFEAGIRAPAEVASGRGEIVYGDVQYIDVESKRICRMPIASPRDVAAVLANGRAPFTQQGTFFARDLWVRSGGFDERWSLAADYGLWCRATADGSACLRVPEIVASFRLHRGQLSADRVSMHREMEHIRRECGVGLRAFARRGGLFAFRAGAVLRIAERLLRTGTWSSEGLYAKYCARS
ncbi:hypothetical protein [Congregicoccus parvus]|uniref:hypothetical protein n=1 Tax=Congregicoccus parvus TaxID=3081749 RepID=UPI003FA5719F